MVSNAFKRTSGLTAHENDHQSQHCWRGRNCCVVGEDHYLGRAISDDRCVCRRIDTALEEMCLRRAIFWAIVYIMCARWFSAAPSQWCYVRFIVLPMDRDWHVCAWVACVVPTQSIISEEIRKGRGQKDGEADKGVQEYRGEDCQEDELSGGKCEATEPTQTWLSEC